MQQHIDDAPQVNLDPNMQDPDRFYEELLNAHDGLTTEQSFELNTRLLMLLANQIGNGAVLSKCIGVAKAAGQKAPGRQAAGQPAGGQTPRENPHRAK